MPDSVSGPLVIADLGAYTTFLTGSELDHAHDILADLLGVVADGMRPAIPIAKLEGDAVFCADPNGDVPADVVLSAIESCYASFARRRRTIERLTTCTCAACEAIPRLTLKFVAHRGEFVARDIAGSPELVGTDVIRVHRLLKNSIPARDGRQRVPVPQRRTGSRNQHACGQPRGSPRRDLRGLRDDRGPDSRSRSALARPAGRRRPPGRSERQRAVACLHHHRVAGVDVGADDRPTAPALVEADRDVDHRQASSWVARRGDADSLCRWSKGDPPGDHRLQAPRHFTYNELNPIGRMRWTASLRPADGHRTQVALSGQLLEGALQCVKHMFLRRIMAREIGRSLQALVAYGDRIAAERATNKGVTGGDEVLTR